MSHTKRVLTHLFVGAFLLVLAAGCAFYDPPPKDAKSALVETDGVSINKVDGKVVVGSSARLYPGKRTVEFSRTGPSGEGNSYVVNHWTVSFDVKEGAAYRFSAEGRELHVTDTANGKSYRLTASGAVPIVSGTVPTAAEAATPAGKTARILSATVRDVGGVKCVVTARIQINGYANIPFTLRATIVNQAGKPIASLGNRQFTATVKTGDDEDTDSYRLDLPWSELSLYGERCYAKLELVDGMARVVNVLSDRVDLYTDVHRQ